jgi:hypothetical protein
MRWLRAWCHRPLVAGVAEHRADNSAGAADIRARSRPHVFANSAAADAIALTDIGADCSSLTTNGGKTNGTNTRSVAGKVFDVDAGGVWVNFL